MIIMKNKYLTFSFTLLLFLSFVTLQANEKSKSSEDLNISLSNLCEYIGKIQTNDSGAKNTCSFLPSFAASYEYPISLDFKLAPQIGFTLPQSGRDPNVSRMTLFTMLNSKYATRYVNFIAGLGLYFTRISGPGGESVLNNGTGSDSFPLPSTPVYSRNLILNFGVSHDLNNEWSVEMYTYVFNTLSSEDRAFSLGLGASYHFGELK